MMEKLKRLLLSTKFLDVITFVCSFLICRWFYMNFVYFYAIGIIGFANSGVDFWRPLIMILILTIILFLCIRTVYTRQLSLKLIILLYVIYFLGIFFVLFLKSRGVQGLNLNVVTYFKDMASIDFLVPLFNLLMFVPLGLLFKLNYKNILLFIAFIFFCEVLQYSLKVGVFDIGDLLLNTLGFIFGLLVSCSKCGNYVKKWIK
ncbi:hypothetical protein RR47_GL000888 [Enterococcus columbae DSM 7374 = ATCC 51263]|nr:hypothetical protein RR47_GL000888 [Enterococcus columbae DSM 7374 = ATCC 51263]